uniref:Uncharacterized protein n=1 Tax=Wuchereria bancrofti TaxID=6293 RepID=A0A1I8ERX6_WUCBA
MISERTSLKNSPNGDTELWNVNDASSIIIFPGLYSGQLFITLFISKQKMFELVGEMYSAFLDVDNVYFWRAFGIFDRALDREVGKECASGGRENDEETVAKNITLLSVYPPLSNSITPWALHFSLSSATAQKHRKVPLIRLPRTLRPEHYDLQLDFTKVISKEQISGNISILLKSYVNSTTLHEVVFHAAANVHIDGVRLHHQGKVVRIERLKREHRAKVIRLQLEQPLKNGWFAFFNGIKTLKEHMKIQNFCGKEKKWKH